MVHSGYGRHPLTTVRDRAQTRALTGVPDPHTPRVLWAVGGHPLATVRDRTLTRALSGVPDTHTPRTGPLRPRRMSVCRCELSAVV